MKLSKYVIKIPYGTKVILYNTVNDMIVLCDYKDFFNKETKQSLKNNGYYDNSEKQLKDFIKNTKKKRTQLDITISLTESCNLCCKYCSQSGVKNDSFITKEIIDEIIEYIEICKNKYGYKTFSIHLFGGEPLLQKQKILYLNSKLKEKNIPINYYMDTNGILLSEKFIKEFDNITFCVTLSNKCDHDNLRVTSNNTGSYDLIMENLNKIQYVLDNNHRLMVRYNVNDRNINDLEEFLKTIENIKISDFVVAYTNNYKENLFINKLPYKKYKKWNSKKIIPLLEKYNYPISLPTSSFYCKGYEDYSIKVFSNGKIGMCNAYDINNSKYTLKEILENYYKTKKLIKPFEEERNLDNIIDEECKKCALLYICNGKYYCRDNKCDFLDYNLKEYIKSYVKNVLNK